MFDPWQHLDQCNNTHSHERLLNIGIASKHFFYRWIGREGWGKREEVGGSGRVWGVGVEEAGESVRGLMMLRGILLE